ncbi:uncharacterized protein LOC132958783 isoform X2 [Labrus mixtus]|uniref:uncharacterized protein LOC132958783 isoform X2 n=1 Tax=Labrus mixtus TaxID=508554 RepID=UPI0029C0C6D3|nr:uncharacterized protein LOC132958783 isoform X2 [Labrus mixtus]
MHWTAKITVALLNVAWIFFFLQADPFSVFVERRSSDEEMLFGEFCLHLQSDTNPTSTPHSAIDTSDKTNNTNTTAEATKSNLTSHRSASEKTRNPQNCHCNNTKMLQKDSEFVSVDVRPLAPGCEPKIIMTYTNMEVCMDPEALIGLLALDLNETTPATSDTLGATSSEVTTDSGMTESSTSAASLFTNTHRSAAPVPPQDNQNRSEERARPPVVECCFRTTSKQIRVSTIKEILVQHPPQCPIQSIIIVTKNGKKICMDPESMWVKRILKVIVKKMTTFEVTTLGVEPT